MTTLPTPDAETLSCAIAGRYAGRWARSVAAFAVDDGQDADAPAPWFVDGFSGADLQRAALRGATVQPAAIAAVQALDAAGGSTRIILIEEDPGLIARLADDLEGAGAEDRVRLTSDPASAEPGDIVLVEAPFASVAARLAGRIGEEPALVRLAPLSARAMPWTALRPFASLPCSDLLIRLPGEDFAKQARFASPLADLPPHVRRVVEGCSAMLADPGHGWLLAWREAERSLGPDQAVARMAERMRALLAGADEGRFTRALPVGQGAAAVHLLLSTPRREHTDELDRAMGAAEPPPPPRPRAHEPPAAAAAPAESSPADAPPSAQDPPAMLDLFASQTPPTESAPAPRTSAPRARKPRPPAAEELGLFDDPED